MEDENNQLELNFPAPDEFPSFDEVPDDEAQAQVPDDSFDEAAVSDEECEGGCCKE